MIYLKYLTCCLLGAVLLAGCKPQSPAMPTASNTTPTASVSKEHEEPKEEVQEIERIDFEDLNCNIQPDLVFREWMLTPRAKELDGQRVRLAGYMLGDLRQEGIEEFVLLKNTECKFGPGGQADHLAMVVLDPGETTKYTDKPVDVIGTLRFKPFNSEIDGNTWAIYEIEAEAVRPMRR